MLSDDSLSFYKHVSSEDGWDFLKFYEGSTEKGSWSGEVAWSQERYWITTGTKTLKWSYIKDGSYSVGDDAAYLDYIIFPPMQLITSTEDLPAAENDMIVYPNPATGEFVTISVPAQSGSAELKIYAVDGRLVYCKEYTCTGGQLYLPVEISAWQSGVYSVVVSGSSDSFSGSFAITK
ncbi:hypothetical protein SDC9_85655 [bioreactor metagenome]|uniref:Secretion system C-terminal sorting domain-containing protein n=1 Tax=bioreactor metagenome TaxID=1076179 RepID=A0A644ZMQ5_9ZZZZ